MIVVRLYHIPTDAVQDLREAFEDEKYHYCVAKWNLFKVSPEQLCSCPEGVAIIKKHLPALWKQ